MSAIYKSILIIYMHIIIRGSFIKFQDWGCNFSKYQVISLKLSYKLYIYISDLFLKFHSFIMYSFNFMHININA